MTWTDTANDFTGFKIERTTGTTGTYALLTTVGPTVFSYTDTGLPVGTNYCYQVKATNAAGDSPPSNQACATVATPVMATLTSPTPGSTLSGAAVTFTWAGGVGVSLYQLDIGTTLGGTDLFNKAISATTTSATVSGLPRGGRTIYVRLWSVVSWAWQRTDYTYTAAP